MEDLSYMKPAEPIKFGFMKDLDDRIPKHFSFSVDERLDDAIQVYLRLKPDGDLSEDGFLKLSEEETNSLVLKKKTIVSKFSFSYIFKPSATQEEIFLKTTEDNLRDFFNGKNVFIFTYGASSSGKTFTIQGKKKNPGLIPRIIASIFGTLGNSIEKSCNYCPERSVSVVELSENDLLEKNLFKEKILSSAKNIVQLHLQKNDDIIPLEEIEMLYRTSTKLKDFDQHKCVFSIWISFFEIYNEKIYDLFDESKHAKTPLTLSTELDKRVFIKGLQHINVATLEEAYLLYYYGCCNRSVSYTLLNERSSRSHSIFTIKILGRQKDSCNFFVSSSFSVCDLAGTERFSKTRNVGSRMKEAQSINSSFLVLNRCLKIIRENQLRDAKQVVPYRESKLTQLMGSSFTTQDTNLVMIVTVAQSQKLREETETSLKSSAIATEIKAVILSSVKKKKKTRFSSTFSHLDPGRGVNWNEIVSSNKNTATSSLPLQDSNLEVLRELDKEKIRRLEAEAKLVELEKEHKKEIERLVDEHLREKDSKNSVRNKELEVSKFQEQTKELETLKKQQEELYDKYMNSKVTILGLQKKLRLLKDDYDQLQAKYDDLESTCEELEDMLDSAKEEVEELQKENKELNEAVIAKDEALALNEERISLLELEVSQLEDNLRDNAEERDAYDKLVRNLEDDLCKKAEEAEELNYKLVESTKIYEAEIKSLKMKLEGQNNRESRRIKEKNGNIPILRIQNISLSDDDQEESNLWTPRRSKSAGCHRKFSDSDDQSFLLPVSKKKVTSKKKKKRQEAKDLESSYYFDGKTDSSSTSTCLSARRRLYKKNSEELSEPSDSLFGDNTQASPTTIFRTLRTGKKY